MQNKNRLIDDFKNQTMDTVWKFLDAMAVNYSVYSTHLKGLSPFLADYDVYLYCNDTNIVILCLDCCGHGDSQVYEESDTLSSMIFEADQEPRASMVWKLKEAVRLAKTRLQGTVPDVQVYGVLLTEAEILNAYDLYRFWDANNVTVIDALKRVRYRRIKTNGDDDLACKAYVEVIMDSHLNQEETDVPMDQETLMKESDEFEEIEDVEEDFLMDDDQFPVGKIEQNQSISVKVEVLHPIPKPREELNQLVGCAEIKKHMDELVALTCYNKMIQASFPNSKQHQVSLHSVFLGRPGTGKTTVCKIYGSLLRQAGALSKGHVVVCNRGTFIGTLWGDEERSMRQVLEMAQGGVLMIDEAYLLNGKNDNDPGKLVIQLLMNILADEKQRDIAVVLCGYKEPMMKMLATNPGLISRFPNKFEFKDFTVDELLEITRRRLKHYDYSFTVQAWEKYRNMLAQVYQVRDAETWGNARFVANQLERIYIQHAARCVKNPPKSKNELLIFTPEDILPVEIPRQKTKIGF